MFERLRALGPGVLLTGTAVGAGDLLTSALAGSEAGLAIVWAVPAGIAMKWTISEALARWQMGTGQTLLEGWVLHLGRWIGWIFLPYLLLFGLIVGGALTNACGVAGTAFLPIGSPEVSKAVWGVIHSLAGLALVWTGSFGLFKAAMSTCVVMMFVSVLLALVLLPPDWGALAAGLVPSVPAAGWGWVLGLLGGIGGTMTLLSYGYWIREDARSGREGLRLCRADLAVSYIGTAIFGVGVLVIGSRIELHGQGTDLARVMADQLGQTIGPLGRYAFLLGVWGTVFSSVLGVWQSLPWIFVDFLRLRKGLTSHTGGESQSTPYRVFLVLLATVPLLLLATPVRHVQLAFGVLGALFLPLLTMTLLLLNNRVVAGAFRNGRLSNATLAAALGFFVWMGVTEIRGLFIGAP